MVRRKIAKLTLKQDKHKPYMWVLRGKYGSRPQFKNGVIYGSIDKQKVLDRLNIEVKALSGTYIYYLNGKRLN